MSMSEEFVRRTCCELSGRVQQYLLFLYETNALTKEQYSDLCIKIIKPFNDNLSDVLHTYTLAPKE